MLRRLSKLLEFIMKTCRHSWNKTKLMSPSWIWNSEQRSNSNQMLIRVVPNRKCAILVFKNKSRDNVGTLTPWWNVPMLSDCVSCFLSSGKQWDGLCLPCAHITCVVYSLIHICIASNQFTDIKKPIIFSCHLYWNNSEFCLRCLLWNFESSVSQLEGKVWSC